MSSKDSKKNNMALNVVESYGYARPKETWQIEECVS